MIESLTGDAGVRESLEQLRPSGGAVEALARVSWSVLTEPGDGVAGALIEELGASDALRLALGAGNAAGPEVSSRALADGRARWKTRADARSVVDALCGARDVGARLLIPGDAHWPTSLDDLGVHAPAVLWVRGDPRLLSAAPRVAIVGARAASAYGEMLAGDFAGELAAGGAVVVSGGAYGIDGAGHRAALGVGGKTVAFLAGGRPSVSSGPSAASSPNRRDRRRGERGPVRHCADEVAVPVTQQTHRCGERRDGGRGGRMAKRIVEHCWTRSCTGSTARRRARAGDIRFVSRLSSAPARVRRAVRHHDCRDTRALGRRAAGYVTRSRHGSRPVSRARCHEQPRCASRCRAVSTVGARARASQCPARAARARGCGATSRRGVAEGAGQRAARLTRR